MCYFCLRAVLIWGRFRAISVSSILKKKVNKVKRNGDKSNTQKSRSKSFLFNFFSMFRTIYIRSLHSHTNSRNASSLGYLWVNVSYLGCYLQIADFESQGFHRFPLVISVSCGFSFLEEREYCEVSKSS